MVVVLVSTAIIVAAAVVLALPVAIIGVGTKHISGNFIGAVATAIIP